MPSGSELTAKSQRSQTLAVGDRTAVCREMCFVVQIYREIFRPLRLDDLDVFGEDLVIEVESLLNRRVFVEVSAEGDKEPGFAG